MPVARSSRVGGWIAERAVLLALDVEGGFG